MNLRWDESIARALPPPTEWPPIEVVWANSARREAFKRVDVILGHDRSGEGPGGQSHIVVMSGVPAIERVFKLGRADKPLTVAYYSYDQRDDSSRPARITIAPYSRARAGLPPLLVGSLELFGALCEFLRGGCDYRSTPEMLQAKRLFQLSWEADGGDKKSEPPA